MAVGIYMAGCTVTHGDTSLSFLQLAPGDDVQSRTTTLVGLEAAPLGVDGPQLRLGYIRSQQSRVPSYEAGTTVPAVSVKTAVDGKGIITESLDVDDNPAPKGWFAR
jgi:hypothetical protein